MSIGSFIAAFGGPIAICYAIVCLLVGYGVYVDAKRLQAIDGAQPRVLSPEVWALLCIFGSVPAVALYWAAHHSSLAK